MIFVLLLPSTVPKMSLLRVLWLFCRKRKWILESNYPTLGLIPRILANLVARFSLPWISLALNSRKMIQKSLTKLWWMINGLLFWHTGRPMGYVIPVEKSGQAEVTNALSKSLFTCSRN